ncbi:reverse transcriptase domain-containing protein [Halomonas sp. MES3-P3E]|uniref:reverse transcriptase domain-containing protein n=1 Tax=Halomonas sp. MES3-P3E TaxID=2058321 RepID=UPI0012FE94CE|nr:reverse transcriptase domain-containing protein [Halomonas sp. MES3-P3E]
MRLTRELNDGSYQIGKSVAFVVSYPKWREVWAAQFRDRVVHHVMYNRIAERFYKGFIHDSYACIPGRGSLMGVDRVHAFMRQATQNWQQPAHFLQADLSNFFVSINKEVLFESLCKRVPESVTRRLIAQILFHDPTQGPIINSPAWKFRHVPRHKSLFNSGGKGLPIGNLSSQFFANVHLDALDQFVKRELGIKRYGRYVDDVVMVDPDPQKLNDAFKAMQHYATHTLDLAFHPNKTQRNSVYRGINFCGYVMKPHRRYVRRRSTNAMKEVAHSAERYTDPEAWAARMNSYLGICQHANTYRLRKQLAIDTGATFGAGLDKVITRKTKRNAP